MTRLGIVVLACAAIFMSAPAVRADCNSPRTVAELTDCWQSDWNSKQLDAVVQLYEDGGTLRTVDGNFHGRDQIKEYLKTEIASGPQFAFSNAEPIEANKLGYDSGTFKETSTTGDGSLQERDGSYLLVARKDDKGAWEIAQHAFVDQKPGPSVAPCPACFVKNDFERAPVLKAEYYSDRTLLVSAGAFGPPF